MNNVLKLTTVLAFTALGAIANAADTDSQAAEARHVSESGKPVEANLERARRANAEAARLAAESVRAQTQLDLDIRLIGPTSVKIAGDRQGA